MTRLTPFEDLIWYDPRVPFRQVFVVDRRDRPKMKWSVAEATPEGGDQYIWNGGSLIRAVEVAMRETEWQPFWDNPDGPQAA